MTENERGAGIRGGMTSLTSRAATLGSEPERRHETLMERAEQWGLTRGEAEDVYALAEEERLEPELALLLVSTGVGAVELGEPEPPEIGGQQNPPEWVATADMPPDAARRERRLRLSFRRLRSLLETSGSAAEAVRRFAAEPDVVEDAY